MRCKKNNNQHGFLLTVGSCLQDKDDIDNAYGSRVTFKGAFAGQRRARPRWRRAGRWKTPAAWEDAHVFGCFFFPEK